MWSGPTARLLSDGLRKEAAPCGPSNPTPSPSKLATSAAPGRAPCDRCSMAAAPGGLFITGGVGETAGPCCAVDCEVGATNAMIVTSADAVEIHLISGARVLRCLL